MPLGRFRVNHDTLAVFHEDGRHVARTVPEGAVIRVDSAAFDGDKLVDVTWNGKKVMMFTQDLRSRAEAMTEASAE